MPLKTPVLSPSLLNPIEHRSHALENPVGKDADVLGREAQARQALDQSSLVSPQSTQLAPFQATCFDDSTIECFEKLVERRVIQSGDPTKGIRPLNDPLSDFVGDFLGEE